MINIVEADEDDAGRMAPEGAEIISGGAEVHVRFVRHQGDPAPAPARLPPFGNGDEPDRMEDLEWRLAGLLPEKCPEHERRCEDPAAPSCRTGRREGIHDAGEFNCVPVIFCKILFQQKENE